MRRRSVTTPSDRDQQGWKRPPNGERTMSSAQAAAITARLDRLPASAYVWRLVVLLSLGGLFEIYDLFLTPYVMPGLIRSQIFQEGQNGLFRRPDQASVLSCTFACPVLGTV